MNENFGTEADELDLLDVLVVVAENIKLLLSGTALAGLLALGVSYVWPSTYQSQAIIELPMPVTAQSSGPAPSSRFQQTLPTPAQAAAMMTSSVVLDAAVEALGLANGQAVDRVRGQLAAQVKATVGKDGLLRVDVSAGSGAQAHALAQAVLDAWLKSTVPGEQERQGLEKRLAYAQNGLKAITELLQRMAQEGPAGLSKPLTRGEAGTSLVAVGDLQARYLEDVLAISRALQGVSHDVIKQPPTLPTEPVSPKKKLLILAAVLGAGFMLLVFVFARQGWRNTALAPQAAPKIARLQAALRLR